MTSIAAAPSRRAWVTGAGALLGLVAYGTYDMTNLSTLRNWSLGVSLVDMAWGTALTAMAATGGYFITRWLAP